MNTDFSEHVKIKTDQELIDIYLNAEDYQEDFVKAAVEELEKRNVNINNIRSEKQAKQKITQEQYAKGRKGNELYIVICFVSAFLGGIIGIVGGYVYSQSKHSDEFGTKYYVYDKATRDKGKIMMVIGLFVFVGLLGWRFG
jgi:hypothetical protein